MFKKLTIISILAIMVALPVGAAITKATLINDAGKKVVVVSGSQEAQRYFGMGYYLMGSVKEKVLGGMGDAARDIIGSRVGTSTTGVAFTASSSAPTIYNTFVGDEVDSAVYSLIPTSIGASPEVLIQVFSSNDSECDTTSTTTTTGARTTDINWYDAGSYILNLAGSATTITGATTTLDWIPTGAGQGKQVILNNLNVKCLSLRVAATSTTLYAQLKTKTQ